MVDARVAALQKRIASDMLTPLDKERMATARELRALRKKGLSFRACAEEMGKSETRVKELAQNANYKLFCEYFDSVEQGTDAQVVDKLVRKAKQEFAAFAPDALSYFRTCYERNPPEEHAEKGEFKDDAKAMWATERVAKGLGLTEPETAVRPVVQINIAHIRMEQAMVAADDAEADAVQKAIDVTPEAQP
jgi:hypothetical protein